MKRKPKRYVDWNNTTFLQETISQSKSLTNTLKRLGLHPSTKSSRENLTEAITKFNLDTSSFVRPTECVCETCGREYIYDRKKGHTRKRCNSCAVNERRFKLKQKCVEYKGGACECCGYNKCLRSLDFHHLDPTTKDFTISGSHSRSWSSIKSELDKCILVCRNCHGEIHEEDNQ